MIARFAALSGWMFAIAAAWSVASAEPPIRFPASAVVDATRWSEDAAMNLDPSAGGDDTAAMQALVDRYSDTSRMVYFPPGVYDLSAPIVFPISKTNRSTAKTILQGAGREHTRFRLADHSGVEDAVWKMQIKTADAFRNAIRDLTIDIGVGNPAATGLRFVGCNQAIVSDVDIVSSDPERVGKVGLELGTGRNGPLLVRHLKVVGFDVGIHTAFQTASQTFEHITLHDQRQYGWVNEADQNVFVRDLQTRGSVTAVQNFPQGAGENAVFTLLDSHLVGTGVVDEVPAIRTEERLFARNVKTEGFGRSVVYRQSNGYIAGNRELPAGPIDEYWSEGIGPRKTGGVFELFPHSPDTTLQLPIAEVPQVPWEYDLTRWASPADFIRQNDDGTPSGIAGDEHDDAAALTAAFESGATTIYFPADAGTWVIDSPVTWRAPVRRIIGTHGTIGTTTRQRGDRQRGEVSGGAIEIGDAAPPVIIIERLRTDPRSPVAIRHQSNTTIVATQLQGFGYLADCLSPGDLFINDVVDGDFRFRNQNVWARQLNVEGKADASDPEQPDQKLLNDGGRLWALGTKVENVGTIARTINGGRTELLGVYRNNNQPATENNPAFVTVDAATSVVNFDLATAASDAYALWVSETRGDVTQTAERFGGGHVYAGFDAATLWDVQRVMMTDDDDPAITYRGDWTPTDGLPGGYLGDGFRYADDPAARAFASWNVPQMGSYEIAVRWVNNFGRNDHTGHSKAVPILIDVGDQQIETMIDQRRGGGRWVVVGQVDARRGEVIDVVVGPAESGKVIVDGFRATLK